VYAIGGNALDSPNNKEVTDSSLVLAKVMSDVVDLLEAGWNVVLTHGNGPQVGHLMSLDSSQSMDSWVAATQGMIGHSLSLNLDSILRKRNRPESTAVVLTRVEVDPEDEGFTFPTKPVGPILTDKQVMSEDWDIAQTVNGPRRVVASPLPKHIIDINVIRELSSKNAIVICSGGGGIPVVRSGPYLVGVPAVIDKDYVSSLLAVELNADALVVSTAIDSIRTDFGLASEKVHQKLTLQEIKIFESAGQFPKGSMGPKVSSMADFVNKLPNSKAVLCQPGDAIKALRGMRGTTITVA
tara:strand:- start:3146 stop:4036 length:891 start_codon:yes stop_codon:yes gene_type:complete